MKKKQSVKARQGKARLLPQEKILQRYRNVTKRGTAGMHVKNARLHICTVKEVASEGGKVLCLEAHQYSSGVTTNLSRHVSGIVNSAQQFLPSV